MIEVCVAIGVISLTLGGICFALDIEQRVTNCASSIVLDAAVHLGREHSE